jgi:FkbM family methyltransferase
MSATDTETPTVHYSLAHRVTAVISQRLFANVTYTVNHGLLKGLRRRGGLGWVPEWLAKSSDTAEHQFFRSLDLRGKVVYDVGAFIGLFAMHCARTAQQVICFEPLERNRNALQRNLALNQFTNVRIRPVGVGRTAASVTISFDPLMPGGASVASDLSSGIMTRSSSSVQTTIQLVSLDADRAAHQLPVPDLIKIDIEGNEHDALLGAEQTLRTHHPALYLEMHGETMADKLRHVADIVHTLTEYGYESIVHIETNRRITTANSADAAEGHLYCTRRSLSAS